MADTYPEDVAGDVVPQEAGEITLSISHLNRVAMAQETLSRYIADFKSRWQPTPDHYAKVTDANEAADLLYHDLRDFEVELTNLVQSAFTAAQAPFAMELYMYRQNTLSNSLLSPLRPLQSAPPSARIAECERGMTETLHKFREEVAGILEQLQPRHAPDPFDPKNWGW